MSIKELKVLANQDPKSAMKYLEAKWRLGDAFIQGEVLTLGPLRKGSSLKALKRIAGVSVTPTGKKFHSLPVYEVVVNGTTLWAATDGDGIITVAARASFFSITASTTFGTKESTELSIQQLKVAK